MAREPEEWIPPESSKSRAREERALALERDRLVRSRSVAQDTRLNLPVSVPRPDGEELYRGATSQPRNYDQHAEITKGYIQGPPNKTVWDSPDWRDWNSGVLKTCSCSPGSSQARPKSSSTGQLSSWGLHWSRSGKSPPSHSRTRCHHHQRHSHPSNSKNSCSATASTSTCSKHSKHQSTSSSSSTCSSSTSSSTSSCAGLISGVLNPGSNGTSSNTVSTGVFASIGGKIQNAFSDKNNQTGAGSASIDVGGGGERTWTSSNNNNFNNNNSTNSGILFKTVDKTKLPSKSSKGYYSQNVEKSCSSGTGAVVVVVTEPSPTSSSSTPATTTTAGAEATSSSLSSSSSSHNATSVHLAKHTRGDHVNSLHVAMSDSSGPGSSLMSIPASKWTPTLTATSSTSAVRSQALGAATQTPPPSSSSFSSSSSHREPCVVIPEESQVSAVMVPRQSSSGYHQSLSTPCENVSLLSFSQNNSRTASMGVCETERQRQDCSVNDDNGNGRVQLPLIREQCGDIQSRLEDVSNTSDSKDLQHEQNEHLDRSRCEPLS